MNRIMGNSMVHSFFTANMSTKRKASVLDSGEDTFDHDLLDSRSKECTQRKKEAKTSKYIYKTLFEEQQGSDVRIKAFGKAWNLHKIYLSQSPYFYSMFNGDWLEAQKREIDLIIDDNNVTPQALNKVFSSFYQDEIEIEPAEAVSIIGVASLLQMDHLIQQCVQVMKFNINIDSVIEYFENADLYSLKPLKDLSFDWLLQNLMYRVDKSLSHLSQISCGLMASLIRSPNLVVIQTEFSIYILLKQWVYLREKNRHIVPLDGLEVDKLAIDYFKDYSSSSPFLLSEKGEKYKEAFLALRLRNLISHSLDSKIIDQDCIIPGDWFSAVVKEQWTHMLKVTERIDTGPTGVSEEIFNQYCTRFGRIIEEDKEINWRWTGYYFGIDLVINYNKGTVSLSRSQGASNLKELLAYRTFMDLLWKDKIHNIMYRIAVYSLDKNGKVLREQKTGIKSLVLQYGKPTPVLTFECDMKFPILFSANFLFTTPPGVNNENKRPTNLTIWKQFLEGSSS